MSLTNTLPQRTKHAVSIVPVENDGTPITSLTVDRKGYGTATLQLNWASSSGSPTTALASLIVYTLPTDATTTTYPLVTLETVLNIKTAGLKQWDLDLSAGYRYLFCVLDITYTDGSSPKNILGASVVLGDKDAQPANSATVYGR